jgi:hypothetical protein
MIPASFKTTLFSITFRFKMHVKSKGKDQSCQGPESQLMVK